MNPCRVDAPENPGSATACYHWIFNLETANIWNIHMYFMITKSSKSCQKFLGVWKIMSKIWRYVENVLKILKCIETVLKISRHVESHVKNFKVCLNIYVDWVKNNHVEVWKKHHYICNNVETAHDFARSAYSYSLGLLDAVLQLVLRIKCNFAFRLFIDN